MYIVFGIGIIELIDELMAIPIRTAILGRPVTRAERAQCISSSICVSSLRRDHAHMPHFRPPLRKKLCTRVTNIFLVIAEVNLAKMQWKGFNLDRLLP